MKKSLFLFIFIPIISHSQNKTIDSALDTIWQGEHVQTIQNVGPESLGQHYDAAPILPPATSRKVVPGTETITLPIEESDGPLNLSPNDTQAYIIYNRATIAFRNQQFEKARELYRDLIRKFPASSYTPYALYTLSLSEKDYRRKIRILLTITERFPNFAHVSVVLDRLGDIYYILNSPDAAEEVFKNSKSSYSLYMRAVIAMDYQKPNQAIRMIKEYLKTVPDKESAYKVYVLYSEALILLKKSKEALTVLEKASELRPWAYDNGVIVLLNSGKAFYHSQQYNQSLYAFSVLRLRFSRSIESRLADQYITTLSKMNVVNMSSVPWIAKNFETLIKEQPIVRFKAPNYPSVQDVLKMNTDLPPSAIKEPSLDDITYLPAMPIPAPKPPTHSVLVPLQTNGLPAVDVLVFTNTVYQEITNTVERLLTNKVFVIQTNTLTNSVLSLSNAYFSNLITNVVVVTNAVNAFEPVVIWQTNIKTVVLTNTITNRVEAVVTNSLVEVVPSWQTNYIPTLITNFSTNIIDMVITNALNEIVPIMQTQFVPFIQTNYVEKVNEFEITNIRNIYMTNLVDYYITNIDNVVQTNIQDFVITNYTDLVQTNVINQVITNVVDTEVAPIETPQQIQQIIIEAPQEEEIETPEYETVVEEPQKLYVTPEVARLQNRAAQLTEKAAGIAGDYRVPDKKGYVIRIAQVKDLSVANILIQDINQLERKIPVGIYYRDELYFIEVRNIREYEDANELSQYLYTSGYTEIQLFEQFDVIEYQE